jgi:hypothetical protein
MGKPHGFAQYIGLENTGRNPASLSDFLQKGNIRAVMVNHLNNAGQIVASIYAPHALVNIVDNDADIHDKIAFPSQPTRARTPDAPTLKLALMQLP